MREKWVVAKTKDDYTALARRLGVDPVIVRMMVNRGVTDYSGMEVYLHGTRADLHDPHLLKDVDLAAEILAGKIHEGKKIRIIGDYDIDGIQATYILFQGLKRLGAQIDYELPDRIADGYGLNVRLVTRAHEAGVDTILTCDNGIAALNEVELAKKLGMTVVVTDHHEVPFEETVHGRRQKLVCADAVVDPKRDDCPYPFKELCGAAVAFKLMQVLYEREGIPVADADIFIENAGFATVGDVMALCGENRILVKLGLQMLQETNNVGMRALILQNKLGDCLKTHSGDQKDRRQAVLDPGFAHTAGKKQLTSCQIGFVLGPCLNAGGRLETAELSLKLLLTEDPKEAAVLAQKVVELNESRKLMTAQAVEAAEAAIAREGYARDKVLVIFLPDCHESLAGIVAGRIRERYYRPTFIVTRSAEGAKGSARSIEGYSMYEEMCKCSELFTKFGGHPMAAGFSLAEKNVDLLRKRLNGQTALTEEDLRPTVLVDAVIPMACMTQEVVQMLELLEPCGNGNARPVFADRDLTLERLRFSRSGKAIFLTLRGAYGTSEAIYFGSLESLWAVVGEKYGPKAVEELKRGDCGRKLTLHFLYYPEIDTYYETPRLKFVVKGFC